MPQDVLGVRIAVVKLLFPPGEKKGANDTLELRRSSLSFMEGERHTHSPSRRCEGPRGRQPMPSHRPAQTKRKEGEEPLR